MTPEVEFERGYRCPACPLSFPDIRALSDHEWEDHEWSKHVTLPTPRQKGNWHGIHRD